MYICIYVFMYICMQDLKLVVESEGQSSQSNQQRVGPHHDKQIGLYHRVRDADLIEDVLSSFKQRPLYSRIMSDESESQNTSRSRRHELLNAEGRGRSRSRGFRQLKLSLE